MGPGHPAHSVLETLRLSSRHGASSTGLAECPTLGDGCAIFREPTTQEWRLFKGHAAAHLRLIKGEGTRRPFLRPVDPPRADSPKADVPLAVGSEQTGEGWEELSLSIPLAAGRRSKPSRTPLRRRSLRGDSGEETFPACFVCVTLPAASCGSGALSFCRLPPASTSYR